MPRTRQPRAKYVFTTVVQEGHDPPSAKHVKQSRKVLRAFYDLPPEAARLFGNSLIHDENCHVGQLFKSLTGMLATSTEWEGKWMKETFLLQDKLKKHRRPRRNAERDAEIMRLHDEGKTAGDIVLDLADRWVLTDKQVNAVISRENKRPKPVK